MLTASRCSGPLAENTSIRSTRLHTRSVSSRIRRVSGRSSGRTLCSRSCAAPRMPASGFFTSCASIAAIAPTDRAAPRCVNLPVDLGGERALLHRQHDRPVDLRQRRGLHIDDVMADPRAGQRDLIFDDGAAVAARLADEREQRTVGRHKMIQALAAQIAGAALEELLSGIVDDRGSRIAVDRDDHRRQHVQNQVGIDLDASRLFAQSENSFAQDHLTQRRAVVPGRKCPSVR